MKRFGYALLLAFALSASAVAQPVTPNQYRLDIFAQGATTPTQSTTFAATLALCNQPKVTLPPLVRNPTRVVFDDAANAGRDCILPLQADTLTALPFGIGFTAFLSAVDTTTGQTARSAASNPFNVSGLVAPQNLRIVP